MTARNKKLVDIVQTKYVVSCLEAPINVIGCQSESKKKSCMRKNKKVEKQKS